MDEQLGVICIKVIFDIRSCPPAQPMHQRNLGNFSVGLSDVLPPSEDCGFHQAHILLRHLLCLQCHLLGLVSYLVPLGVSSICCTTQHILKQCL